MPVGRGLASFDSADRKKQEYRTLGRKLIEEQREQIKTQLQVFQNALITFRKQHAEELRSNPELWAKFNDICRSFGIDPLVISSLGIGTKAARQEKYNQLALRIIEICRLTKNFNGGILSVQDLLTLINCESWFTEDPEVKITEQDVLISLENLKALGDELQLMVIGSRNYIKSTTEEINADQGLILSAADVMGYVSVRILRDNFKWKRYRCESNLDDLVSNGILWIDDQSEDHERIYWITSWINN